MVPGHLRGKGHKIQLPKLPGRWKGLSRVSREAAPPSAGSKLPLLCPAAPPFSLGLPRLPARQGQPTHGCGPQHCVWLWVGCLQSCRQNQPLGRAQGPNTTYRKRPCSAETLCLEWQFGAQPRESPLCTNPMQRMKCLEPCPVQTPYFRWEKLSGQAGRQGARRSPWRSQSRRVPSSASPPAAPSRPMGLTGGCGPSGPDFSLAQGPGLCLSWNPGGSAVAVTAVAFSAEWPWTVCLRPK